MLILLITIIVPLHFFSVSPCTLLHFTDWNIILKYERPVPFLKILFSNFTKISLIPILVFFNSYHKSLIYIFWILLYPAPMEAVYKEIYAKNSNLRWNMSERRQFTRKYTQNAANWSQICVNGRSLRENIRKRERTEVQYKWMEGLYEKIYAKESEVKWNTRDRNQFTKKYTQQGANWGVIRVNGSILRENIRTGSEVRLNTREWKQFCRRTENEIQFS